MRLFVIRAFQCHIGEKCVQKIRKIVKTWLFLIFFLSSQGNFGLLSSRVFQNYDESIYEQV